MGKFYDIFVRHAFGSFRDVLKEVSYNPLMAKYLSFLGNRAKSGAGFPDENYAGEVMQLFSIGEVMLNPDGTRQKDPWRQDIPTYGNEAIVNFAQAWTGFDLQAYRTNIENGSGGTNFIDPMRIGQNGATFFRSQILMATT